jgi:phage terminase large subunit GpA-like protein
MATGFAEGYCSVFKPRARLMGSAWADKYRVIAPGTSPEPGAWVTARTPYLREILDVCTNRHTSHIVLMMSSQVGKSEVVLNLVGYYIHQDPSPILMVQPTKGKAEEFSKERLDPTIKASPALCDLVKDEVTVVNGKKTRKKKDTETITNKSFPGGYIAMEGAETESGLSSRPIKVLLMDEVDRYKAQIVGGDPRKIAIQRTTNFKDTRKIVEVSTPGLKETSRIYNDGWLKSDQRRYNVPCQCCGTLQALKWGQVKWNKTEAGDVVRESIRYECESCGHYMRGAYKMPFDLLEAGVWIAENPGAEIAGFHINSMYSPWVDLYDLVNEFVTATRNRDKDGLKEFVTLKLGEPWEDTDEKANWEELHKNNRHRYGDYLPANVLLATAGVDTQDHYLAVEVVGWGAGKETWGIKYALIMGDTSQPEVWNKLDQFLQRTWQTDDGRMLPIFSAFVDSGGHRTDDVYSFCKARQSRGVYAIRGSRNADAPVLPAKPTKNNKGGFLFELGVGLLKSTTLGRAAIKDEGPGYCHFPIEGEAGYSEDYFRGLLSERFEFKYVGGKYVRRWVQIYDRNEPLDCRGYATAAFELLNIDLNQLAARVSQMHAGAPAPSQPARVNKKIPRQLSAGMKL